MASTQMWLIRTLAFAALCILTLTTAGNAQAQSNPTFDEAMKLMRDGEFEKACPLLENVLAVESTMIVRFRLAECYEQVGRLASALNAYQVVAGEAALSGMSDREAFAKKKAAELEPKVPKLKLIVPPEVGTNAQLQITVDGKVVHRTDWGRPQLLDLGSHTLAVAGPGYETWSLEFSLDTEREVRSIQVPNRQSGTALPTPTPTPTPTPGPDTGDEGGGMSTMAIIGIVVLSAGVVLTATGIGVGVAAKGTFDDTLTDTCNETVRGCTPEQKSEQDSAVTQGNVATALFVIGLAAAAGGAVMWILAPPAEDVAFGITPGGVALRGTF